MAIGPKPHTFGAFVVLGPASCDSSFAFAVVAAVGIASYSRGQTCSLFGMRLESLLFLSLVVIVCLYERVCDLLATVQWRYQNKQCSAGNQKTQTAGAGVPFFV